MVKALFVFHGVMEACIMGFEKTRILKIRGKESRSPFMESAPCTFLNPQKQSRTIILAPSGIIKEDDSALREVPC